MAHERPLHETGEDLLYRQKLRDRLRKHSDESIINIYYTRQRIKGKRFPQCGRRENREGYDYALTCYMDLIA